MRKVMQSISTIKFGGIFSKKSSSGSVAKISPKHNYDQEKLRKSAQKTLSKYKKTFRKLAFE